MNMFIAIKWINLGYYCKSDQNFIYLFHNQYRITTVSIIHTNFDELDKADKPQGGFICAGSFGCNRVVRSAGEFCPDCLEKSWCWRGTIPTICKCLECERADLQELMEIPERHHLSRWERCIAAKMYSGIKPCELLILNPENLPMEDNEPEKKTRPFGIEV